MADPIEGSREAGNASSATGRYRGFAVLLLISAVLVVVEFILSLLLRLGGYGIFGPWWSMMLAYLPSAFAVAAAAVAIGLLFSGRTVLSMAVGFLALGLILGGAVSSAVDHTLVFEYFHNDVGGYLRLGLLVVTALQVALSVVAAVVGAMVSVRPRPTAGSMTTTRPTLGPPVAISDRLLGAFLLVGSVVVAIANCLVQTTIRWSYPPGESSTSATYAWEFGRPWAGIVWFATSSLVAIALAIVTQYRLTVSRALMRCWTLFTAGAVLGSALLVTIQAINNYYWQDTGDSARAVHFGPGFGVLIAAEGLLLVTAVTGLRMARDAGGL
ncbi:hypothetical protein [Nocardia sp. IFM 10818]